MYLYVQMQMKLDITRYIKVTKSVCMCERERGSEREREICRLSGHDSIISQNTVSKLL